MSTYDAPEAQIVTRLREAEREVERLRAELAAVRAAVDGEPVPTDASELVRHVASLIGIETRYEEALARMGEMTEEAIRRDRAEPTVVKAPPPASPPERDRPNGRLIMQAFRERMIIARAFHNDGLTFGFGWCRNESGTGVGVWDLLRGPMDRESADTIVRIVSRVALGGGALVRGEIEQAMNRGALPGWIWPSQDHILLPDDQWRALVAKIVAEDGDQASEAKDDGLTAADRAAGWRWLPPTPVAYAALIGRGHSFARPLATVDDRTGEWITYPNCDDGPRGVVEGPADALLAAGQRAAVRALRKAGVMPGGERSGT